MEEKKINVIRTLGDFYNKLLALNEEYDLPKDAKFSLKVFFYDSYTQLIKYVGDTVFKNDLKYDVQWLRPKTGMYNQRYELDCAKNIPKEVFRETFNVVNYYIFRQLHDYPQDAISPLHAIFPCPINKNILIRGSVMDMTYDEDNNEIVIKTGVAVNFNSLLP